MNATQLLTHFDRLAEAPDAVPRLRRLVLELAIRGKLVEQDSTEEPAHLQLVEIAAARALKVGDSKPRQRKVPTQKIASELPFPLPTGWSAAPLAELTDVLNGRAYGKNELLAAGTPVLRVGNLFTSKHWYYSNLELDKDKYCDQGDLIFSWSASFGPFIWNGPKVIYHYHIWKLPLHSETRLDKHYLYRFLLQQTQQIKDSGHGVSMVHMTKEKMEKLLVPVPPLAEQHRIVAKVDELMALCDELEAAQKERERRRDRLAAASLQRLNQPTETNPATDQTEPAEARQQAQREQQKDHARFHLQNLDHLTTRPEHIKAMRQTILNLAVRGELVRSVSSDGTAESLLTAIAKTKSQLAKTGAIRKTADLPPLPAEEAPFPLPRCWTWERLGTVGYTQTGTTPPTSMPECFGGKTPFVTPSDLTASVTTYVGKGLTEIGVKHSRLIAKNSALMVCIGSTIGKVNTVDRDICCNQQINTFTPVVDGMTGYIATALRSDFFQQLVMANAGMGTLPILSKGKWEMLPVPLPPLAEQHRIVAKVDELMALCDQLEAQLIRGQNDSRRLLEAVLEAAIA